MGYDFHFDTVVLGMDFEFGTTFGKLKKSFKDENASGDEIDVKTQMKTQWQESVILSLLIVRFI